MSNEPQDFRTRERIKAVAAILVDYRKRRLRYMLNQREMLADGALPASLTREAEALAILRELNLA